MTEINKHNFNTFWDNEYLKNCPTRYIADCFSVGYNFYFVKETIIFPKYTYILRNEKKQFELSKNLTKINDFQQIEFGPFNQLAQTDNDIIRKVKIEIYAIEHGIIMKEKLIFKTIYNVPDYAQYSYEPEITKKPLEFKFIVSSCFSLPGYRRPVSIETYYKLAEICNLEKPDQFIISGDVVYMDKISLTSNLAVQQAYNQLKEFEPIQNIWSQMTFKTSIDDHDVGYNDTYGSNTNIKLFREVAQNNFPIELILDDTRLASWTIKDITFIIADDISNKKINSLYNGIGVNKFESQLGLDQINIIKQLLTNVWDSFGINGLVFIIVGKSMFASTFDTFVLCQKERDILFSHIKYLGLRNVIFICGDSHQSDMSEFVIDNCSGQKIREIRNSAIGSKPRDNPNDNPYQIEGTFIGGKNVFGLVTLNELDKSVYKIKYDVYDSIEKIFTYTFNTEY